MTASRGVARFHAYAASVLLPLVTGTVPSRWTGYYLLIALVAMALALPARRAPWSGRLALGLAALAVSAAAADTAARPFTARWLYARPDEAFVRHWPPLPIVPRFESNVDVETEVSGDLARGPRFAAAREPRRVRFTTDAAGFPNEPGVLGAAPDLILLGDSFGVGVGTTREDTWGTRLGRGRRLYNLSVTTMSPWQEYVTLGLEIDRLGAPAGTPVLWAIFTGNDLDEVYSATVDLAAIPRNGPAAALAVSWQTFRNRSPVRQVVDRLATRARDVGRVLERDLPGGGTVLFYSIYDERRRRDVAAIRAHPSWPLLAHTVPAAARMTRDRGLRLSVVLVPSKEEVYAWLLDGAPPWSTTAAPSGFAGALAAVCREQGVPFLDLKPALLTAAPRAWARDRALLWWRDDTHWNARGHAVAAAAVREHVLDARP